MNPTTTITTTKDLKKSARCTECHAYAELFISGIYAGIWACTNVDCMASDNCEHLTTHPESFTLITENGTETMVLNICDVCHQNADAEGEL